jgi:hypothetical protein
MGIGGYPDLWSVRWLNLKFQAFWAIIFHSFETDPHRTFHKVYTESDGWLFFTWGSVCFNKHIMKPNLFWNIWGYEGVAEDSARVFWNVTLCYCVVGVFHVRDEGTTNLQSVRNYLSSDTVLQSRTPELPVSSVWILKLLYQVLFIENNCLFLIISDWISFGTQSLHMLTWTLVYSKVYLQFFCRFFKILLSSVKLHIVMTQKTVLWIHTTMATINLTPVYFLRILNFVYSLCVTLDPSGNVSMTK